MSTMGNLRAEAKQLGLVVSPKTNKEEISKMIADAQAKVLSTTHDDVSVGSTMINPAMAEDVISNAVVHSTTSDEQLYALIERQEKEKIMREQIAKRLRQEAQIAERKLAHLTRYNLKYDVAELMQEVKALAEPFGGVVTTDKSPDGGLGYGFHIACRGKIESFPFAQEKSVILSKVRLFFGVRTSEDMKKRSDLAISPITGQPVEATVQFGDEALFDNSQIAL